MSKSERAEYAALAYRVRVIYDPEPENALHDPEGNPLPGSKQYYDQNPIMELVNKDDDPVKGKRRRLPYREYCESYGNPDRHVVCAVLLDRLCPTCGTWEEGIESLWGIDFMDNDKEAGAVDGPPVLATALHTLPGYLADVAKELLSQAGVTLPQEQPS